jgi:hypothetical protein
MMRRLVSPGNPRGSGITLLGVSHLTRLSPSRSASLKSEFGKSMAFALTIPDPMHDLRGGGTVRAGTPAQQRDDPRDAAPVRGPQESPAKMTEM